MPSKEAMFEDYKEILMENPRAFIGLELLKLYIEADTRPEKLEILKFFKEMEELEP